MCRIGAIKSLDPIHPSMALNLMTPQQEGHDNSGFALVMQDLQGVFGHYKNKPLLSLACTPRGLQIVDDFMAVSGFSQVAQWAPDIKKRAGLRIEAMPCYVFKNYDYPEIYKYRTEREREDLLLDTRLELRKLLEAENNGFVYSFWPDVLTLKEIGDPCDIAEYFNLRQDDGRLMAKNMVVQCRQNTNYGIVRYAAHPFFLQGYTLCANGENTFYTRNTEYQKSLHRGYTGFESDSQNLLYTMHYVLRELAWPVRYYKHVITPLPPEEAQCRPDAKALSLIRESLGPLQINGPNAVIGLLPDGRMLTVCDSKKLRPVVCGGNERIRIITSEVCGLNAVLPHRKLEDDIYLGEKQTLLIDNDLAVNSWLQ